MEKGFQYVQNKIKDLPSEPGCYLMKDHEGQIFYIGKAKNLKSRIKSYFLGSDTRIFVQYLEHILYDLETLVVRNDIEALILERELIKKHKPKFNILLRDDKNYILLRLKHPKKGRKKILYPRLEIVRRAKKDGARYFGPYPSANRLRTTVELINKYFGLRTCPDQVIENRKRPCIQYQIGRCPAPCVYDVDTYDQEIDNVILFLSGNYNEIKKRLTTKMWVLSQQEQFEAAAKVRDQLEAIKTSLTTQVVSEVNQQRDQDIIGLARSGPEVEIVQIKIRKGTWHKSENFAFSDQPFPSEEILRSFLHQAYQDNFLHDPCHDLLISLAISHELSALKSAVEKKLGRKFHIIAPTKGKQKRLVDIANKNAQAALDERIKQTNANERALVCLQEKLGLKIVPKRMECIDISLIQGTDPYGSCVVFIDGKKDPSRYRKYIIKSVEGMDDFSMIHEVVSRRIKRGIKDNDLPDLLLIDGGKGQLNAALSAIEKEEIIIAKDSFYVAGIAKARALKESKAINKESVEHSDERLFVPNQNEPITLKAHTFERYLVEKIRNEAHRFAISAHRNKRAKRTLNSALLEIPGVAKKRALMLLKHFGSVKNLRSASLKELEALTGIGKKQAQIIFDYLRKDSNAN